jgi:hypothetical protein
MMLSLLFLFACSEKKLGPEDVEYRKDENGTLILYEIDLIDHHVPPIG